MTKRCRRRGPTGPDVLRRQSRVGVVVGVRSVLTSSPSIGGHGGTRGSQLAGEGGERGLHHRFGLLHAWGVLAVGVAVSRDDVSQGELLDPVVVFRFDPVGVGLPVLAEQDQRGGVGGLGGERAD